MSETPRMNRGNQWHISRTGLLISKQKKNKTLDAWTSEMSWGKTREKLYQQTDRKDQKEQERRKKAILLLIRREIDSRSDTLEAF